MLLIRLQASAAPYHRQIRDRIARLVDDGVLAAGSRLPPTRRLARTLGVHRTTVVRAYRALRAWGYLESRPGSYTTVRRRLRPAGASTERQPGGAIGLRLGAIPDDLADSSTEPSRDDRLIDFASHAPDPTLAPDEGLRGAIRRALSEAGRRRLAEYPDPRGLPSLREAIARRLATHSVAVSPEEIVVTNGTQHALDLAVRLLVRPGGEVAVEAPTYGMFLALLRLHRIRPRAVPMASEGLDLDRFRRLLSARRPAFVYTMPNFHNPTGITTSQAHREALLGCAEASRVPVLEDGFDEELKYSGPAVLPIKSIDARGLVLYLGTLSKVAYPGLRIGWIAAPRPIVARLAEVVRVTALGGNGLGQAVAAELLESPTFESHLRRAHRIYRRRLETMLAGLEEHLPPRVTWTRPAGGYTLWLSVKGAPGREAALAARIARAGVRVAPGRGFFPRPPATPHFRISISSVDESRILDGCRRLGAALG